MTVFVYLLDMKLRDWIFFVTLFIFITSCKDDKVFEPAPLINNLKVTMQPTFGANDLQLDQIVTTSEGYNVQFTDIKCYFTSVKNGANELCQAALYDFRQTGTFVFQKEGKPENFESFTSFLGVDPLYNHQDPSAFPNDNPLNISIANDMHWDWNPGYIFLKVEAKVDTLNDGIDNFNHFVIFHVGSDAIIQTLSFTSVNWISSGEGLFMLPLKLDLQKFLQNGAQVIDLKTEHSSHSAAGQEALSLKVIQNFKDAISIY